MILVGRLASPTMHTSLGGCPIVALGFPQKSELHSLSFIFIPSFYQHVYNNFKNSLYYYANMAGLPKKANHCILHYIRSLLSLYYLSVNVFTIT